jgi:hypothetical protein
VHLGLQSDNPGGSRYFEFEVSIAGDGHKLNITWCDTPIRMTRANNVLKYQSLDHSLVQYIIQVVHSRTTLVFKYKTLQHDDDTN